MHAIRQICCCCSFQFALDDVGDKFQEPLLTEQQSQSNDKHRSEIWRRLHCITIAICRNRKRPTSCCKWAEDPEEVHQERQALIDLRPFVICHWWTLLCQALDFKSDSTYDALVQCNEYLSKFSKPLLLPKDTLKFFCDLDAMYAALVHSNMAPLEQLYRTLELRVFVRELFHKQILLDQDRHPLEVSVGVVQMDLAQHDIIHISADAILPFEAVDSAWTFCQYHMKYGLWSMLSLALLVAIHSSLPTSMVYQVDNFTTNFTSNLALIPAGKDITKWFGGFAGVYALFHAKRKASNLRQCEAWKLAQSIVKMQHKYDEEMDLTEGKDT